jgi:hypothetical protein
MSTSGPQAVIGANLSLTISRNSIKRWFITIRVRPVYADISMQMQHRRPDDPHDQGCNAAARDFRSLEWLALFGGLVFHFIVVGEPGGTQDGVVQSGGFYGVGGSAERRQVCPDLATVPHAELAGHLIVDAQRGDEDQSPVRKAWPMPGPTKQT